jgi:hypothetical protein
VPFRRFWGFDSFVGLPPETSKRSVISAMDWQPGSFSAAETMRSTSFRDVEARLGRYINDTRVHLIRGFYNTSLTPTLATERRMRPALHVFIDCDLYVSTRLALTFLCEARLLQRGSWIIYNDWDVGGVGHFGGERKAHAETVRQFGLQVRFRGREPAGAAFQVEGVPWSQESR